MLETLSGHYTLKQIFEANDNWPNFVAKHSDKLRPVIIKEVEKMLACRDPLKSGYHKYTCESHPEVEVIVPHTCKSRFCSSCGTLAVNNWIDLATSRFLDAPHHHIVFTIPEQLRNVFLYDRSLLNILFTASARTVLDWCQHTGGYLPGNCSVIHTFGSQLNFNPHIHMLVTSGGLSNDRSRFIANSHIPWNMLKARWKYHVVTLLKPKLKQMIIGQKAGNQYLKLGTASAFSSFLESPLSKNLVCLDGGQTNDCQIHRRLHWSIYQTTRHCPIPH